MEDQDHALKTPIKISDGKGGECEVYAITLVAPVKKFIRKTYNLQQYFKQAHVQQVSLYAKIASLAGNFQRPEDKAESEDEGMSPTDIMETFKSSEVDIEKVMDEFERIALLGALKIDDENLKKKHWDDLDFEDQEALFAKYMSFFIEPLAQMSY